MLNITIKEKSFQNEQKLHTVIKDLQLALAKGEFVAIVGPTGCGKTTLLRLLAGLDKDYSGSITLNGNALPKKQHLITMMFQQQSLFPWLSLYDNIGFSLKEKKWKATAIKKRVTNLITMVGLNGFAKSYPHTLSGGMQQRGVLARALAYDPEILLLDEPFAALDDKTRRDLQGKLLQIHQQEHKTILLVTHSIDEALFLADRVLVMGNTPGNILYSHTVSLIHPRNRTSDEFSKQHLTIRNQISEIITPSMSK